MSLIMVKSTFTLKILVGVITIDTGTGFVEVCNRLCSMDLFPHFCRGPFALHPAVFML